MDAMVTARMPQGKIPLAAANRFAAMDDDDVRCERSDAI